MDRTRGRRNERYGWLLIAVLITITWTAAAPDRRWAHALVLLLQSATLFGALRVSRAQGRLMQAVVAIWSGLLLLGLGGAVFGSSLPPRVGGAVFTGAAALLLALALAAVLNRLIAQPEVTLATVQGAVSAYLLLGLMFSFGFAFLSAVGPPALTGATSGRLSDHLYFSYTTMTTVGFGDVAPAVAAARAVAVLEALLGQLYLVTVLALAVGNLSRRTPAVDHP